MPTLFDDEDFYVPPPKKENKAKKDARPAEKELSATAGEAEEERKAAPTTDESPETSAGTESPLPVPDDPATLTPGEDPPATKDIGPEPAADPQRQGAESGISFEVPDEDEAPAPAMNEDIATPIPGVKDEVVDDLDRLLRMEIIAQDYTAFSAFRFEPEQGEAQDGGAEDAKAESGPVPTVRPDAEHLDLDLGDVTIEDRGLPVFELENRYYTIGEVAALFSVNVSHIRFWTTEFKLKVRTTRKGDRLYDPENIARLRLIHHLVKENKYTIKGAKEQLKTQRRTVSQQVDLKEKLSGLKNKLERIKRNL